VTRAFGDLPIRLKLIAMIMTTCAVVLVLASLGYLVVDYYQTRAQLEEDLRAQSELILQNSLAALEFDDDRVARETLDTLSSKPSIQLACLYGRSGKPLAGYRRQEDSGQCPPSPPPLGVRYGSEHVQLTSLSEREGRTIGTLLLLSDLAVLARRGRIQLGVVSLVLVLALVVAVLLSSRLQRIVSAPITALANTAGEVSRRGDYSLRAARSTDDELGDLVEAFNRMLERIESREAELSKANQELRREVAERRRAEQECAELLVREREANRLKDEFLATLSHELRTPLNAILGWTKLLRANAVPVASMDRALEKVERNAQVQSRLIEDLLEISRIVSGKLRLDPRPFDVITLCSTAVESIRPAAETRGVTLQRRFETGAMPTVGDPDRIQQVIWNLLSNAVKFTPSGGSVTLTARRVEGVDEIIVSDTGVGIDPVFLPKVFETFRQADASTTRTYGGLGLGLSIVRQLVDLHGGEVTAASEGQGRGATFTVRLPVRAIEPRRPDIAVPPPESVKGRLSGRDVLIVDDDRDTRELLASALDDAGARVRAAASAEEALTLSLERVPDAIVSDLGMPGEDGYTLMQRLHAALGPQVPRARLALSAFAGDADRDRALSAGFQHHVAKPADPHALIRLLEEMLKGEIRQKAEGRRQKGESPLP
jgi:signal transduction histidine kinase/ActR/RegA family two-component response regulator